MIQELHLILFWNALRTDRMCLLVSQNHDISLRNKQMGERFHERTHVSHRIELAD